MKSIIHSLVPIYITLMMTCSVYNTCAQVEKLQLAPGTWHDPTLWFPSGVPTSLDTVVGLFDLTIQLDSLAVAARLDIRASSTLMIEGDTSTAQYGRLLMKDLNADAIINDGTIQNEGRITLRNINLQPAGSDNGITNTGLINNLTGGRIICRDIYNKGIHNIGGQVYNAGEIFVFEKSSSDAGIQNGGYFENQQGGIIEIFDFPTSANGIFNNDGSSIVNYGVIDLHHVGTGIENNGAFNNYSQILTDSLEAGQGVFNNGIFINHDTAQLVITHMLDPNDEDECKAITNAGTLDNYGTVLIDESGPLIQVYNVDTIRNYGLWDIRNGEQLAMLNLGYLQNDSLMRINQDDNDLAFVNEGDLVVGDAASLLLRNALTFGLSNNGIVHVSGMIDINGGDLQIAFYNQNQVVIDTSGMVQITPDEDGIYGAMVNDAGAIMENMGTISIFQTGIGIANGGRLYNHGDIHLDSTYASYALFNDSLMVNEEAGRMTIINHKNTIANTLINDTDGTLDNKGVIHLEHCDGPYGIHNLGRLLSSDSLLIYHGDSVGIVNDNYMYVNGVVEIAQSTFRGLHNKDTLIMDTDGRINIYDMREAATVDVAMFNDTSAFLQNDGRLDIDDVYGYAGFYNMSEYSGSGFMYTDSVRRHGVVNEGVMDILSGGFNSFDFTLSNSGVGIGFLNKGVVDNLGVCTMSDNDIGFYNDSIIINNYRFFPRGNVRTNVFNTGTIINGLEGDWDMWHFTKDEFVSIINKGVISNSGLFKITNLTGNAFHDSNDVVKSSTVPADTAMCNLGVVTNDSIFHISNTAFGLIHEDNGTSNEWVNNAVVELEGCEVVSLQVKGKLINNTSGSIIITPLESIGLESYLNHLFENYGQIEITITESSGGGGMGESMSPLKKLSSHAH